MAPVERTSTKPTAARAEIKSDLMSHMMHLGARDYESGTLDAKPVTCMGWLYFEKPLDMQTVREEVLEKCVKKIFRYRAVPLERDGWTFWQDLGFENIDLDYHFQHVESFDTEQAWEDFLADEARKGIDFAKPWWRYILVDRLADGRSALIAIVDHTMNDGASAVSALLNLADTQGDNPVFSKKEKNGNATSPSSGKKAKARNLTLYEFLFAQLQGLFMPFAEQLFVNDPPTKLKQPSGVFPKKWSFASTPRGEELDVTKLKAIKDRIPGATVNDVLLAVTALAIREYYRKINEPIMSTKSDIHGTLAVNTRPAGVDYLSDEWFGNHIVIGTARYPLHETRLQTVCSFRDQSRLRKAGPDTLVREYLAKALSFLPREKIVEIAADASCKFSIMLSNVCFSLKPVRVFGQYIDDVRFIACSPLGMYVGAGTYCNKVSFSSVTTSQVDVNPHDILAFMKPECDALYDEVMHADKGKLCAADKPKTMPFVLQVLVAFFCAYFMYAVLN